MQIREASLNDDDEITKELQEIEKVFLAGKHSFHNPGARISNIEIALTKLFALLQKGLDE